MTLGVAGSGRFVLLVVLLINLGGGRPFGLNLVPLCSVWPWLMLSRKRSRVGGQSTLFQKDRTDNQSSQPVTQPVTQSVSCSDDMDGDWTGGRLFGREKAGGGKVVVGGMRNAHACAACMRVLGVLQTQTQKQTQAQGRTKEGRTGETLAARLCVCRSLEQDSVSRTLLTG